MYDDNGNLVIDLNKNITPPPGSQPGIAGAGGVIYNYLDKPEQITLAGKGVIKIVYDADGNKLQRMYLPEAADKPNATVTTYIDQYLYQEIVAKKDITAAYTKPGGTVQYLNFEEGRIRVVQPVTQNNGFEALQIAGSISLPNGKQGSMDYYIRDYQQNVRVIVTDETHLSSGTASMEQSRATQEEGVFGQTGGANELAQTRWPVNQIPGQQSGGGWQNPNIGNSVARLGNLAAGKVGPNSLLKVMAGDQVSATAQYYYQQPAGNSGSSNIVPNVINSLVAVLNSSAPDLIHRHLGDITNQLTRDPALGSIIQPTEGSLPAGPKAYLSVLFFDERFNFIGEASNQKQATEADNSNASLTLLNLKAPKNGYAYIYVSNSSDVNVFFDNLKVAHNRGRIVEENHYYAFGLRIAGISSRKLADGTGNEGQVKNEFGYNDKELFDDGDLNLSDYGFRNYDPQIGRFVQIDPLTDDYPMLSGYHYALNDPITNVDIDGLFSADPLLQMVQCSGDILGQGLKVSIPAIVANVATKIISNDQQKKDTKQVGQQANDVNRRTLDGQKGGLSQYDVDVREDFRRQKELEKLIKSSWVEVAHWEWRNEITGETKSTAPREALGDDLVGQAFGFYAMGRLPMPKFRIMKKLGGLLGIAAKGGFDAVGAFKNAISPFKGGNLTNAGRAVTKHPEYFGFESTEALMKVYRSPSALNNLGSSTLKDILRNGVRTTGAGGRYPNGWVTYTLPNGNAASWELDGTFIGFRGIR